jgi:hypothetical protein
VTAGSVLLIVLEFCWGCAGTVLGLCWGCVGVVLDCAGLCVQQVHASGARGLTHVCDAATS